MSAPSVNTDSDVLDLLRSTGPMTVADLADVLEVTPTAVRQRLMRMMAQALIQRDTIRKGRGRPRHLYRLTDEGVRLTGSNFTDLALALWREIAQTEDHAVRSEMVTRVAKTLAEKYFDQIQGETTAQRMRSLGELLAKRRIPVSVDDSGGQLVMTAHACPYPSLAEQDRGICQMEKQLFSELLAHDIELTQCRLDGGKGCRFQVK